MRSFHLFISTVFSLDQSDYRSVLLHDSLLLFGSSLSSLSTSSDPVTERLNCSEPDTVSSQGDKMLKHLHRARLEGLTGEISFTDGRRDSVLMNLVMRGEEGRKTVGVFNTGSSDLVLDRNILEELEIGNSEERVKVYVTVNLTNAHRFLSEVLDDVSGYFQVDIEWKQQFGNTSLSEARQQKHLQVITNSRTKTQCKEHWKYFTLPGWPPPPGGCPHPPGPW